VGTDEDDDDDDDDDDTTVVFTVGFTVVKRRDPEMRMKTMYPT